MVKRLTVIPEQCSGCRLCEFVCAIKHFGVNNPKKSAVRVICTYPHPVARMPVVCSRCKTPACGQVCPVDAIKHVNGIVDLDMLGVSRKDVTLPYKVYACPPLSGPNAGKVIDREKFRQVLSLY